MCGIAQRTVADWWRHQRPERIEWEKAKAGEAALSFDELLSDDQDHEPEQALLQKEFVADLRHALDDLDGRERDAIALRFGAGLAAAEVAAILDLSLGATKMMLHRAITKLRNRLAAEPQPATVRETELLDEAISNVLVRRASTLSDSLLNRVLMSLAVIHRPPVPPDLPSRILSCVECGTTVAARTKKDRNGSIRARLAMRADPSLRAATIPACVLCGLGPLLVAPLTATGLLMPALLYHASLLILAPLNFWMLWRSYRHHGQVRALQVSALGLVLILAHMAAHILDFGEGDTLTLDTVLVYAAIWLGASLLMAGYIIDWRARRQFLSQVRAAFAG